MRVSKHHQKSLDSVRNGLPRLIIWFRIIALNVSRMPQLRGIPPEMSCRFTDRKRIDQPQIHSSWVNLEVVIIFRLVNSFLNFFFSKSLPDLL